MESTDTITTKNGELTIKTCSFVWKIKNFSESMCKNKEMWIESPVFAVSNGVNWMIYLYISKEEDGYIGLHLTLSNNKVDFQDENYCFTFSLFDGNGKKVLRKTSSVHQFESEKMWGWPRYIQKCEMRNKMDTLLVDNILSVSCKIYMNIYCSHEVLLKDDLGIVYEPFYLNKKFSDVMIIVDQKKLKAHRIVLSARSKVFAAMLEHDMKENNTHTIEINDISSGVMEELLLFMYCGRVNNINEMAKPLLEAADKYDVRLLKIQCEKSMRENLNTENACETLVTSDLHSCQKLKTETIDFIIQNISKIAHTSKFEELKHFNPKLLEEILQRIADKKKLESPE